jgi:hypothetical protein
VTSSARTKILRVFSALTFLSLVLSLPAFAGTRVRGGSGYGAFFGSTAQDVIDCNNLNNGNSCEAFQSITNPAGTFDGAAVKNEYNFVFNVGSGGTEFDVFDLGSISNPLTLSGDPNVQIFACGFNFSPPGGGPGAVSPVAFDNVGGTIQGLNCTPITDSLINYTPNPSNPSQLSTTDAFGKQFMFTQTADGLVFNSTNGDDVVVFDAPGSGPVSTTPEPGSFALLGLGLVALAGLTLRRTA